MTTSAQRPTPAATPAATDSPAQARRSWPWLVAQGGLLVLLGLTAVVWAGGGARVLLAGVGALGVVRGVTALRAGRAGLVDRQAAVVGAGAAWAGLVGIGLALFPSPVAGWACVALIVVALGALVARADAARRTRALLVSGLAVAALAVGTVLAGPAWLTASAVIAVGVATAVLGVLTGLAALGVRRVAATPEPVAPAGCGGCACGAGGCGGLQRG